MSTTPERSGEPTTAFPAQRESSYGRPDIPPGESTRPISPGGMAGLASMSSAGTGGSDDRDGFEGLDDRPARKRHVVDRFDGAVGLFVLRLVTAVIFGIRGLQKLQHLDITRQQFTQVGVPYPDTLALVTGVAELAIAVALVLGIAIRIAAVGIVLISVGALVYVRWKSGNIFTAGQPGFAGELELLLAGVGIALIGLGGGGWGFDRRFRRR